MSFLKANCPSCAAPIEFQKGSTLVLICPFCRAAVSRTDRTLEDLGKTAEIADSASPLRLGLRGEFKGNKFQLTGRVQNRHELGGFWDEWYAVFANGWVGWLAEAQGRFYLTFHQPLPSGVGLPPFESLYLGQAIQTSPNQPPLMVTEKATAAPIAAEGEIPYKLVPGETRNFADLSGKDNAFGSIDYRINPARIFVGWQVTLAEIGLGDAKPVRREAQRVATAGMNCPNCAGALTLAAPDKTERVTCPFCGSLLDVNQGNLRFLKISEKNDYTFQLPIGAKGVLENFADGAEFQIIGAMTRSVTVGEMKYFWEEFLLYNSMIGFRWLVQSDNHWSFVEAVNPAEIVFTDSTLSGTKDSLVFRDKTFYLFQDAQATVEFIKGEFYWRVEQGETVRTADYIAPPQMLSAESTAKEVNWSLGTYVDRNAVAKAFGTADLPTSFVIAPNQKFKHNALIRASLIVLAAFILVVALGSVLFKSSAKRQAGTTQKFSLTPQPSAEAKTVVFSEPFYLERNKSASATIGSDLNYETWSAFNAELVPANAAENRNDSSKVSVGGNPSHIFTDKTEYFNVGATGEYQLRLEGNWQEWQKPLNLNVSVSQYTPSELPVTFLIIVFMAGAAVILLIYKANFETRRWQNTDLPRTSPGEVFSGIFSRESR